MTSSSLIGYTLHLADNALVLGHRNSEWTGHGPILEQDIALSNISLDLIGQARNLYQYAAEMIGGNVTEDTLAYLRDASEYRNHLLVEQDNGDWGKTIMRQFLFSACQSPLYQVLRSFPDARLAAIAEKSLKETTYHLRWSSEWVIRLGNGTEESGRRMQTAIRSLWPYTEELLTETDDEKALGIRMDDVHSRWHSRVRDVLAEAGIDIPAGTEMTGGGRYGHHTAHLEQLLAEMQYMQRTYPGLEW